MAEKVDYAALKKGGFMRQKQKGCFSLRLAVVGGNLTAENIKTVAEVAEKYGHGYVHMTSRQGIEIPFIKVEDINEVKEELAKGGVGTGVCGPRVRTITACQGAAICPSGCIDTYTLAKELDARYFGRELPHKFKFGVTGCQNNCLKAEENDVGIKGGMTVECNHDDCIQCGVCVKACREGALRMEDGKIVIDREKCNNCARCVKSCPTDAWVGEPGYIVSFGGLFGNKIYKGEQIVPIIRDKETLFRVTDAAISFFEKHANAGERFRLTLERVGKEEFKKELAAKRRQLTQAQRRIEELDRLFKRIYEDNISGKINDSRFQKLSADYEKEQAELTEKMQLWEQEITKQEEEADSIEQFIRRAKKYPELTELTPAVLHDLVNKVYVCAPDKSSGHRVQDVRISLACIGFLPESIITEMVNHAVKSRTA